VEWVDDSGIIPPVPAARHRGAFDSSLPGFRPPSWNEADVSDKPRWVQTRARSSGEVAATDRLR
jgi:hypothetical protein